MAAQPTSGLSGQLFSRPLSSTLVQVALGSHTSAVPARVVFLCPPRGYRKNPLKERELFAEEYCRAHWKAKAWKGFSTERDNISIDLMHMSIDRLEVGRNWEYARLSAISVRCCLIFWITLTTALESSQVRDPSSSR